MTTQAHNRYSYDVMVHMTDVVKRWQHREPLNTEDSCSLAALINNVSRDRWNKHYGRSRRDWVDTVQIREGVPLAFIDYLMMKRSIRTYIGGKQVACPVDNDEYHTLPYTLTEFRRQFPRVVSVLTANHCGITLLREWEPRNVKYMVNTPIYTELHHALVIARSLAASTSTPLYVHHSPEFLTTCYHLLHNKLSPKQQLPRYTTLHTQLQSANRVHQRRALAVRAASTILYSRVHAHYDACKSEQQQHEQYDY